MACSIKRILSIGIQRMNDHDPDVSYLEQEGFEDRLEALNNGVFGFIGIRAQAEIVVNDAIVQTIRSGGLWGIESDSDVDYFKQIEEEEMSALTRELSAIGFSERAIKTALNQ